MQKARTGGPPGATPASSTRASSTSRDLPPNQRCEAIVPSSTRPSRTCRSPPSMRDCNSLLIGRVLELEPEEATGAEGEEVGPLADLRELGVAEQLDGHAARERREVELHCLGSAGEIVHAEDDVLRERADVREDLRVLGPQHVVVAEPEDRMLLAQLDEAPQPAQQRRGGPQLRLDVDGVE